VSDLVLWLRVQGVATLYRVQWSVYVKTVVGSRLQDIIGTQVKVCFKHTAPHGSVPSASF
jgi:hypothetical protein